MPIGVPSANERASFYIQTRDFQKRLLTIALEATGNDSEYAAAILGLTDLEFVDIASELHFTLPVKKELLAPKAPSRELSPEEKAVQEAEREIEREARRAAFKEQRKIEEAQQTQREAEQKAVQDELVREGLKPQNEQEEQIIAAFAEYPDLMLRQDVEKALGLSKEGVLRLKVSNKLDAKFDANQKVFLFVKDKVIFFALNRLRERAAKAQMEEEPK